MEARRIMIIAGEPSGDALAAELVDELRGLAAKDERPVEFFGAGGSGMNRAGVELAFDMTAFAVIGLWEAIRAYFTFRRLLFQLLQLAVERRPDVIVCVDFGGFNSRFVAAMRDYQRHYLAHTGWEPQVVQFVSPQVWASRPARADAMAANFDRLMCILPFEKDWWNARLPEFPVDFVGHPIVGRHGKRETSAAAADVDADGGADATPLVALMPGSRAGELRRHLPVLVETAKRIAAEMPVEFRFLLPNEGLRESVERAAAEIPRCAVQVGDAGDLLSRAQVALTKTGTITLECALHELPAVTFYQTSPLTYAVGRRLVKVPYLSMPNLLAAGEVYPEFVQDEASPENLANAALRLLRDPAARARVRSQLRELVRGLGDEHAARRAAQIVWSEVTPVTA